MADDDVGALFKSRKAKKGGKKFKSFSAGKIVKQLEKGDNEVDEESHSFRSATTAENVLKVNNLEQGQWVEEEESNVKKSSLLSSGVSDIRDIAAKEEPVKKVQVDAELVDDEAEKAKLDFHLARAKAKAEADKKASDAAAAKSAPPKVEEAPQERKVWRPAFMSRANGGGNTAAKAGGMAALKQLDNEQVFPSLGGGAAPAAKAKPSAAPAAAWGQVAEEVMESVLTESEPVVLEPVYLGENFYASEKFDGVKPGYLFKVGDLGVGYYWDGADQQSKEDTSADNSEEPVLKSSSKAWKPRRPMNAELPPAESDEEEGAPTGGDLDERFKPSATAWKPRRAMNAELPPAESDEDESGNVAEIEKAVESLSVAAPSDAPDAPQEVDDRFAGLKKKKKKKKAVEE